VFSFSVFGTPGVGQLPKASEFKITYEYLVSCTHELELRTEHLQLYIHQYLWHIKLAYGRQLNQLPKTDLNP
jgi:hypothetical protein